MIKVSNLKKSFDDLQVLKDISLKINEREIVSIIGSSGSGKSTLLRCLTQLEKVDDGEIIVDGQNMTTRKNEKAVYANKEVLKSIRMKTGLVFQNFNLFPHYTVLRNVMEPPMLVQGVSKQEAEQEARKLLKQLGLADRAEYYPHQLSGGQQQRVSIARALAMRPKVLFFDEPTSALDPELTQEVLKVIRSLTNLDMTMVIVTHEMSFAREISTRMIFMDDGYVVEDASPEELFNSENERTREFLGKFSD